MPAGTVPCSLTLPLITLPNETTHVISIAGSTSGLLAQFRSARPDVRYVILGVPGAMELQHLVAHARKADAVISVGYGLSTELEIAFDRSNYTNPFLLPSFDDGLARMPKRRFVTIACRQFTPAVQDAVSRVHKMFKALKLRPSGPVGVSLVGLPSGTNWVNAVQAHVRDAMFPVMARPSTRDSSMKTILQQLSMQATILLVPPGESDLEHAAVFALSKGIPVLVPEGSDTARAIVDANVLSPEDLDRMMFDPFDGTSLDKKLQSNMGNLYNLDELWLCARALQDRFHRKCTEEFVPSFLKAISK